MHMLECPTTLHVGESVATLKHTPVLSHSSDMFSAETKSGPAFVACTSALTYVALLIDGK